MPNVRVDEGLRRRRVGDMRLKSSGKRRLDNLVRRRRGFYEPLGVMASGEEWPCSGKRLWWLSQSRRRAVQVLLEEIDRYAAAPCGIVSEPEIRGDTEYDNKDDLDG